METKTEISYRVCAGLILLFICFNSCSKKEMRFFINDSRYENPKEINFRNVKSIKYNLYSYEEKIYLASEYSEAILKKDDMIQYESKGLFLQDSIGKESVRNIVDINSYEELISKFLYKDKKNVYLFQTEGGCHIYECLKLLDVDVNTFRILDDGYEYASDGNKIYCLRYGNEIKTKKPKLFKVINIDGITFGIDSTHIYSMCEPMLPKEFKKNFQNIPFKTKDSIINKYFGN